MTTVHEQAYVAAVAVAVDCFQCLFAGAVEVVGLAKCYQIQMEVQSSRGQNDLLIDAKALPQG